MTHPHVFSQNFTPIRRFLAWKTHPFWPHIPNMAQCRSAPPGIVSTITVSEFFINKIQRAQNSVIRLALRLSKYVSGRLIHDASGLPYVRERLITLDQNHLARMHANPLVEHTINLARTNIAWDKYKTPISILIY